MLPRLRPGLAALALFALEASAAPTTRIEAATIASRLQEVPPHPRLFLTRGAEGALNTRIDSSPPLQRQRELLIEFATRELTSAPVKRELIGRRLLDKSRTALARVLHLGLAWRLTLDPRFAERARTELLAVAAFPDWNPSHFLDVAEMTAAAGIGYDWFHGAWDEATRATLRRAIVDKGLRASLKADSWSRARHNWNQVCNGGIVIGALAVAESEPALAAELIARAVNTVPLAMHEYAPHGAYPEGAGYWSYGTTYNVMLLAALEGALGTDFGLSRQPGFLATADFFLHIAGPSGYVFNYSDAGRSRPGPSPALHWLAARRGDPYLLWSEWPKLADDEARASRDRGAPLLLLWSPLGSTPPPRPPSTSWTGHGPTPVAFHRSGWERDASFVAIKGGSASTNHAHMDVGAFVMDADGFRWADDLGMQEYNSLESKGVSLWGREQDAQRWRIFRLGASSHNVLLVGGQGQRVDGNAPIVLEKPGRTVVDLSSVYRGQLAAARRGVALAADRSVRVQDEFTAPKEPAAVRWAMVTRAEVRIDGPGRATLTQEGKSLVFRVIEPADAELRVYPTNPPPSPLDAPNPGTRMLGFERTPVSGAAQRWVVQLVPASASGSSGGPVVPLSAW
jgi:hypothetical protein